jgi:6,7-dimethyl-8-ribityllumazine synthase
MNNNSKYKKQVLIIESSRYPEISMPCLMLVKNLLTGMYIKTNVITVPTEQEIAHALNIVLETNEYDGVVILGCVVTTENHTHQECIRTINDVAINYSIPLGFGLILSKNINDATHETTSMAEKAVKGCITLMKIKDEAYNSDRTI